METTISLPQGDARLGVTGPAERNLKLIREALGVSISARDSLLKIGGDETAVDQAAHVVKQLAESARKREPMDRQALLEMIAAVSQGPVPRALDHEESRPAELAKGIDVYLSGRRIKALTGGQRHYLHAMFEHDLTFCIGPAGTGKTYLAVASAVSMLKRGEVRKLVLARPAVEAGEKLGFLPGTMQEKVNPYLRPLLDALHDMMEFNQIQHFMACDLIEIVPLAFMRGRTLNDAMIILDEAQNTTRSQMLMFLTRMGTNSKMVVTGDTTQIDLEDPRESGLIDAVRRLRRVPGVASITLQQTDIVRHSLVQRIVDAYGQQARRQQESEGDAAATNFI